MESQTVIPTDDTGTRLDIEYERGKKIGNIHVQNGSRKERLFKYGHNPSDREIAEAIKGADIFQREYNLKKPEKMAYLLGKIKKGINLMNNMAENG